MVPSELEDGGSGISGIYSTAHLLVQPALVLFILGSMFSGDDACTAQRGIDGGCRLQGLFSRPDGVQSL